MEGGGGLSYYRPSCYKRSPSASLTHLEWFLLNSWTCLERTKQQHRGLDQYSPVCFTLQVSTHFKYQIRVFIKYFKLYTFDCQIALWTTENIDCVNLSAITGSRISQSGGGHQHMIWSIFARKLYENEEIWTGEGHVPCASPDPPMPSVKKENKLAPKNHSGGSKGATAQDSMNRTIDPFIFCENALPNNFSPKSWICICVELIFFMDMETCFSISKSIEVLEESCTLDKSSLLIAIKLSVVSLVRIPHEAAVGFFSQSSRSKSPILLKDKINYDLKLI